MASRMVKVENLMSDDLTITLTDGTDISMQPFRKGGVGHFSVIINEDTLPLSVTKKNGMLSRGLIRLTEAGGN